MRQRPDEIIIGTFFNGGLRAYRDISNAYQPKEVATFVPPSAARPADRSSSTTYSWTAAGSSTRSTASRAASTSWRWISDLREQRQRMSGGRRCSAGAHTRVARSLSPLRGGSGWGPPHGGDKLNKSGTALSSLEMSASDASAPTLPSPASGGGLRRGEAPRVLSSLHPPPGHKGRGGGGAGRGCQLRSSPAFWAQARPRWCAASWNTGGTRHCRGGQ